MSDDPRIKEAWDMLVRSAREQLRPALVEFLNPHISEPEAFIDLCYNSPDKVPTRMLHSLHRLIDIADRSNLDELRVFWICVCAESQAKLSGNDASGSRQRVINFFNDFIQTDDKENLRSLFTRSLGDDHYFDPKNSDFDPSFPTSLKVKDIAHVLYSIRNQVVHGYETYGFSFSNDGTPVVNDVDVSGLHRPTRIESYDVGISYQEFKGIFIRAGIACIFQYREQSRNEMILD